MNVRKSLSYKPAEADRGYTGRILHVDLSSWSLRIDTVPERMRLKYVGGRGYCLKLVFDGTTGQTLYDSPENVLALAGGPYCGETAWVGSGKFIAGTISPLTGSFCDSNVGGHFFPLVKLSGFDAISITGKSPSPVMLFIDGDHGELQILDAPAGHGSLLDAEETLERWKGEGAVGNVGAVTTGKGGLTTWFGCLNSIYYDPKRKRCRSKQAGRGGTGTVMADKGLWGIVVRSNRPKAQANGPRT
jgi:aldehyde:ferredoxin oxidoreductase